MRKIRKYGLREKYNLTCTTILQVRISLEAIKTLATITILRFPCCDIVAVTVATDARISLLSLFTS